ncbi:MAG TPA: hypothetical protein VE136_03480 [Anaerolineales bacterium]|jgi:hypothetical protein|nr:hypothetical protein [Anaerolineales bacterium]
MTGPKVIPILHPRLSAGGRIEVAGENTWRLEIPAGPKSNYRLAQLEDYTNLRREDFLWNPPAVLSVTARCSDQEIPGTWGFGLWNDPFSVSLGLGGGSRLWPALPNAAWFFFASPPNYLSLRDDLPAQGSLAATFRSPDIPALLLACGVPALPLLFFPAAARLLRRLGRRFIRQDAGAMALDPAEWHTYSIVWAEDLTAFKVDREQVFETKIVPSGPLGLVIWVDNQFAALPPSGRLAFGTLDNPRTAWIEIEIDYPVAN